MLYSPPVARPLQEVAGATAKKDEHVLELGDRPPSAPLSPTGALLDVPPSLQAREGQRPPLLPPSDLLADERGRERDRRPPPPLLGTSTEGTSASTASGGDLLELPERDRGRDRSQCRTAATKGIADLRLALAQAAASPTCVELVDALAYRIDLAEETMLELRAAEAFDPRSRRTSHREDLREILFLAKRALARYEKPLPPPVVVSAPPAPAPAPAFRHSRIQLPQYNGETDWSEFWALFEVAVHANAAISAVEKLVHLKTLLSGSAQRALAGLPIVEGNYVIAVAILKERYDQPEAQKDQLMVRLTQLPSCAEPKDLRKIRDFVDEMNVIVHSLEAMNIPTTAYGALVAPLVKGKIPEEWRLQYARSFPPAAQTFAGLRTFINQELQLRERSTSAPTSAASSSAPRYRPSPAYTPAFPTVGVSTPAASPCPSCRVAPAHGLRNCDKFLELSVGNRKRVVEQAGACFKCLGKHYAADCPSTRSCRFCGEPRHNSLLCGASKSPKAMQHPQSAPSSTPSDPGSGTAVVDAILPVVPESCAPDRVFVKIAQGYAAFPGDPARSALVGFYLDDGAQRSYIRDDLCQALGLPIIDRRRLRTGSFGGNVREEESSLVAFDAWSCFSDKPFRLQAWATSSLCPPIRQQRLHPLPESLRQIPAWADRFDGGTREIAVLIGADQIWSLTDATAGVIPGFPTVISTFFGAVLSGPLPGKSGDCELTPALCLLAADPEIARLWSLDAVGVSSKEASDPLEGLPPPVLSPDDPGRWRVRLPFRGDRRPSSNLPGVHRRQARTWERLSPEKAAILEGKFQALIDDEVAELTPAHSPGAFALPYHLVTKSRVVFDGSAKDRSGTSINECLDAGPNLLRPLTDVLVRFRLRPHVVVADIRAAFHQVELDPQDRKWVQFSWRGQWHQFRRLPFGLSSSPYGLHSTLLHHFRVNASPEFAKDLAESFYCDDMIRAEDDPEHATEFLKQAQRILALARMELKAVESPPKVLGVSWDASADVIWADHQVETPSRFTRRELLRTEARVFDPLGLLSPWIVRARLLLQRTWQRGLGWDDPLPSELQDQWRTWMAEGARATVTFPRCARVKPTDELHVFSDASDVAFGFVAYIVPTPAEPSRLPCLLFAKARAAPVKPPLSVPRKELMAALLGARFAAHARDKLFTPARIVLWTDSTCVLGWVARGPTKKDVFVENRLREIAELHEDGNWRYVPSGLNPADLPSRGCPLQTLAESPLYRVGPPFLQEGESAWPSSPGAPPQLMAAVVANAPGPLLSLGDYSTLSRAVRVSAWIHRFSYNARRRRFPDPVKGPLRAGEERAALRTLLRAEQREFFSDEIETLAEDEEVSRSSTLRNLRPRLQDEVVVLVPRTGEPPLPIVPKASLLARLLIADCHTGIFHQGAEATLAEVRRRAWIPGARSTVRSVIQECRPCRRYRAVPYDPPEAALAPFRTKPVVPFAVTGIDHFGPVKLKSGAKAWVLLCTCAVTRALHLELVPDGGAATTARALRKFLSRRLLPFTPVEIHSDNARSFVKLSTARFPHHPLTWKFIPARSPHWGGWWERLVQVVKRVLRVVLHRRPLPFAEMEAVLVEAEAVVNMRPLAPVSSDPHDTHALSPSAFVFGLTPPPDPVLEQAVDPATVRDVDLRRALLQRDETARLFWREWTGKYLASLRLWRSRTRPSQAFPTVGDLVLLREPTPRGQWPLARVTRTFPGRDGVIRSAEVRIRGRTTTRAAQLLTPLEMAPTFDAGARPPTPDPPPPGPTRTASGRPIAAPMRYRDRE
jgi:hypothetical protein